ncbi:MAG TPA: hypothetical protein ENI33_01695 [Thermoplasmatales archaeon]|nr:hypothetical protein [Thermoplasmatales archaeon]
MAIFGMILLVVGNYEINSMTLYGNFLAIIGGISVGVYILGGKKIRRKASTIGYAFIVYGIASLIMFLVCLILHSSMYNIS